ncbi:hypothetical protein [Pseudomonas oryzihabitans]|uniref:hypothetical protein n=1 Tax=Pseudomonas oryzihabitans TaxID=47885 RepID=UPI001D5E67BA|nr:hypothetical protein [Pseudomonas oryzihabitans]HJE68848.1 hypothetical protein [Pseudomonas oryzihabitans]
MTILVQQLRAEIEQLRAQLEMTKKHGEVLQQIGTALRLGAGSDLHTACVPEIVALRRDAERYRWVRRPINGNEVFAMAGGGECGRSMDSAIDQAMTKEQP